MSIVAIVYTCLSVGDILSLYFQIVTDNQPARGFTKKHNFHLKPNFLELIATICCTFPFFLLVKNLLLVIVVPQRHHRNPCGHRRRRRSQLFPIVDRPPSQTVRRHPGRLNSRHAIPGSFWRQARTFAALIAAKRVVVAKIVVKLRGWCWADVVQAYSVPVGGGVLAEIERLVADVGVMGGRGEGNGMLMLKGG